MVYFLMNAQSIIKYENEIVYENLSVLERIHLTTFQDVNGYTRFCHHFQFQLTSKQDEYKVNWLQFETNNSTLSAIILFFFTFL